MESDITYRRLTSPLMVNLVHLDLFIQMTYFDVVNILANGRKLETLIIRWVHSKRGRKPVSRTLSKGDLPQHLWSASFARIYDVMDRLPGLMEVLSACPTLTDISVDISALPYRPKRFSSELLTDPAMWKLLTSIRFSVPTTAE